MVVCLLIGDSVVGSHTSENPWRKIFGEYENRLVKATVYDS